MNRELIFLAFLPSKDTLGASILPDELPPGCEMMLENRVRPRVRGFTPEPLWDVVLESWHGHGARPAPLSFQDAATERWMRFVVTENVVIDGPRRGLKILGLPCRKPGLSHADFIRHYSRVHAHLVAKSPAFRKYVNRYVQHHVVAGTESASSTELEPYDGVSEFWVDSMEHAFAAWNSPEYFEKIRPDEGAFVGSKSHRLMVDEAFVHKNGDAKLFSQLGELPPGH